MEHLIISIATYFTIYSFLGWFLETAFKSVEQKRFINSGFLFGPLCPIYGIGSLIMIFFLNGFKDKYVLLFFVSIIILSTWEYIVGWYLEKVFKAKYWDYSDKKFNIKGRVCLLNSLYWGILAILFIQFIHPFISEKVMIIPKNALIYLNILVYLYFITDCVVTIIKVNNINVRFRILAGIADNIRERIEELEYNPARESLIEELKERQEKLKDLLEVKTRRLRNAFPTMQSENISKYLTEKIDEIKFRIKKS